MGGGWARASVITGLIKKRFETSYSSVDRNTKYVNCPLFPRALTTAPLPGRSQFEVKNSSFKLY